MPQRDPNHIRLTLINSKHYRRLKPFVIALFLISYLLSFVFTFPKTWILALVSVNILSIVYLFILPSHLRKAGYLLIDGKNIVVSHILRQPLIVPIDQIEDLKISRGSTIHYNDIGNFPPEKNDNWISFTYHDQLYKLEFLIKNKKENTKFEFIINLLRRTYPRFYYESI